MKNKRKIVYLPIKIKKASGNAIPSNVLIVKEQHEMDKYWDDLVIKQEAIVFSDEEYKKCLEKFGAEILKSVKKKIKMKDKTIEFTGVRAGGSYQIKEIDFTTIENVIPDILNKFI